MHAQAVTASRTWSRVERAMGFIFFTSRRGYGIWTVITSHLKVHLKVTFHNSAQKKQGARSAFASAPRKDARGMVLVARQRDGSPWPYPDYTHSPGVHCASRSSNCSFWQVAWQRPGVAGAGHVEAYALLPRLAARCGRGRTVLGNVLTQQQYPSEHAR